jgi:DNA-binding NarL/FixJ family response regulator
MTTVLLADDHAAIRAGLRMMLSVADDVEVVGEAADGRAAVLNARAMRPDVVLMDMRMPGMDGIESTRILAAEGFSVIALTTYNEDEVVFGALRAGAVGFLLKTTEPADLLAAVRRVAAGEGALAPEVTRQVLSTVSAGLRPPTGALDPVTDRRAAIHDAGLTDREIEVLAEIGQGSSNTTIARRLGISLGTTKTHVSRVLAKLGIESRTQAALVARDAGLD